MDLEAEPKLDKNNPGDLRPFVEGSQPYENLPEEAAEPSKKEGGKSKSAKKTGGGEAAPVGG